MNESSSCIFCKIVAGELPSTKVYEDEYTLAFLTIAPEQPGHTLVIPKTHVKNILDCPQDILQRTMKVVQFIANAQKIDGAKSIKILQNNEAPLQEVFHLHFHVIPYKGGK